MSKKFDGDIVSLDLLESLTKGLDFTIPDVDLGDNSFSIPEEVAKALAKTPSKVTLEELTSRRVNGSGVFDGIMEAIKKHLLEEYENGRIFFDGNIEITVNIGYCPFIRILYLDSDTGYAFSVAVHYCPGYDSLGRNIDSGQKE